MFLRSILHKKNKKDGDTSPRNENGKKSDCRENGVMLKTDNPKGSFPEANEKNDNNILTSTGCTDELNTAEVTPPKNGNQSCISTYQTPGTSSEETEFQTPPSGSRDSNTSSKKLFDGVVGQQGDGDYVDETSAKFLYKREDEEPRDATNTLPFGDDDELNSDENIERLIQDVLTIVSRELMNEVNSLQDENKSPVRIGSKKYDQSSDPLHGQSELQKETSSFFGKENHDRRFQVIESKRKNSSVPFGFKNAPPQLDPSSDVSVTEDDTRDGPFQSSKATEEKHDKTGGKGPEDGCRRVTGGRKLTESDASLETKLSDHNNTISQNAVVSEPTQDLAIEMKATGQSFEDVEQDKSSGSKQVATESRSKSRIGNFLACRFDEKYGVNTPNDRSSDTEKTKSNQFRLNSEAETFTPSNRETFATLMGPIDQNTSTDFTKTQSETKYFVTDPSNEVSDSSYDVTFESFEVTDVSYESNNENDWSKHYYEQDDVTYDDDCDVFLPHSLEDFVITPCEDTDTEDGDDFFLEGTPRDMYVAKDGSMEGPKESGSPNKREEDEISDSEMISRSQLNGSFDSKTLNITSTPTDDSLPRRRSKEENLEDMKSWGRFRQIYMKNALKCLLEKLQSRAEKLEGSLTEETSGYKEKVLEEIKEEVNDLEEDEITEEVGEMFLMDNLLKSVWDQQEALSSSLRTTEERTSLMEMQLEQWEVGEEDRKQQIVSLREEVEDATARQRSLSAMLSEERRLKEALQLRLATLSQEKQQLLYNNVMLWEQTSQMELKQEHFQSVSAHERNELEEQMKALESELLELRSRKAGEPVKKISSESSCSATSDQPQGASSSKPETDGGAGYAPVDYMTPYNGPYGTPPQRYGNDTEYYSPGPYHYFYGHQRPNANNSGFQFVPPRFPPPFPRRSRPRGRGHDRRFNLRAYFDRLSPFYPHTWYPNQSSQGMPSPRGRGRGGRPFRGRGFSRRGRGRGYGGRGRRENFKEEQKKE